MGCEERANLVLLGAQLNSLKGVKVHHSYKANCSIMVQSDEETELYYTLIIDHQSFFDVFLHHLKEKK